MLRAGVARPRRKQRGLLAYDSETEGVGQACHVLALAAGGHPTARLGSSRGRSRYEIRTCDLSYLRYRLCRDHCAGASDLSHARAIVHRSVRGRILQVAGNAETNADEAFWPHEARGDIKEVEGSNVAIPIHTVGH